jgi:hypothetical protein
MNTQLPQHKIKLGHHWYNFRNTPLYPPIVSPMDLLKNENEMLKQQVNALIMRESKPDVSDLKQIIIKLNELVEPIAVDVNYIRRIYSKPKEIRSTKESKNEAAELRKQQLKNRILRNGK